MACVPAVSRNHSIRTPPKGQERKHNGTTNAGTKLLCSHTTILQRVQWLESDQQWIIEGRGHYEIGAFRWTVQMAMGLRDFLIGYQQVMPLPVPVPIEPTGQTKMR